MIPTTTELTAGGLAELYRDHVWRYHGIPKKMTSDQGPQFAASLMKSLFKMLGVEQNLSTAYHPQTDGQVERSHQETETFLRHYVNHLQDDWSEWLAIAEFQYNDKEHSATKATPFFLNYGRHPWKGELNTTNGNNEAAGSFVERLKETRENALSAMKQAEDKAIHYYNQKRKASRMFQEGDQVWLESTNLTTTRPSKKLAEKRYGPFKIIKKEGSTAYRLELPESWHLIHPVFHEGLLTPYVKPLFPKQKKKPPPPPVIIGGELEFEVEKVLDSRRRKGRPEFLIRWKGHPPEGDTWEPRSNLRNAKESLSDFHKRYPTKPY